MTSPGKYRHLGQCSTEAGHFVILAIDHRRNLWDALQAAQPEALTAHVFAAFKRAVIEALAPLATAVLADPEFGIGPGIREGYLPPGRGLLAPLEVTDYSLHPSARAYRPIDGWSVRKIKRIGGAGVKLLLYYHPEAANAASQRDVVARAVEDCAREDIPLFLEPIAYSLDPGRPLSPSERRQLVIENARTFSAMGIDVLKTEFPVDSAHEPDETVWAAALADLDDACSVPWALLSGGVSYAIFRRQVELACAAGASGVIVGRALWSEAIAAHGAARHDFLINAGRERLADLAAICAQNGRSWRATTPAPEITALWYEGYSE